MTAGAVVRAGAVFVLISAASLAAAAGRRAAVLVADGFRSVYAVDFPLALPGTDSVELDGRRLGPDEYRLDSERGLLLFSRRPPRWTVIRVTCAVLPLAVPAGYYRHRAVRPELEAAPAADTTLPADTSRPATGDLEIGGSKTIGIAIGGPDGSGLNQATRLVVSGTVEGVRVDAELSDQSSPIPPEGTTLELEELDLIRIDLSAPTWQGRFGDVELRLPATGFGTVERRAVGGLVSGGLGPVEGRLGYARPRGRFGRTAREGIDGIQGPYQLGPGGGATLVPGSEAVFLDGRKLTRGWDADYTVDYSTGELVFTSRHTITRLSRIEATYQYVIEAWERSNVIGGVSLLPGGLRVSADYFGEGDDPDRSNRYELGVDERAYLAGIGGDTSRAWLDGGTRVGSGEGDYVLEEGRYRHVGENKGDHRVLFTFVGEQRGDYRFDDSLAAHRYAGAGLGDYVAAYRVELPSRVELGRLEVEYRAEAFRFGLGGLGRRGLVNLLAPGGQPDFSGAAAGWASWTGARTELRYQGRGLSAGFAYPAGDSLVDIAYRWGGLAPEQARHVNELSARHEINDWFELGADLGLLGTTVDSTLARWLGRVRAGPVEAEGGRAGRETRAALEFRPELGWSRPRAGWSRAWSAGAGRQSWHTGIGLEPGPGFGVSGGYRRVQADTVDSIGVRRERETGGIADLALEWSRGDWLRSRASVAHQHRSYPAGAADDWQSWLAGAGLTASPRAGLRLQADFAQSRRLVQLRDEYFRYVGPGQGNFSRDTLTGRYYPDPEGAYERMVSARGSYVPADDRSLNFSGDWSIWRPAGVTATLSLSEVTGVDAPLRRLWNHNVRASIRALEPFLSAWLTASRSASEDRALALTGSSTERQRYRAEVESGRLPGTAWPAGSVPALKLRLEHGIDERLTAAGAREFSERSWAVSGEPVIGRRLRLELEFGVERSGIVAPGAVEFSLLALEAGLGRSWSFANRWRLRGRGRVVRRTASIAELPFEVSLTRPLGWTPGAGLEAAHVLSDVLTLSGRYDFLARPDRAADHRLSAELRAFF